MLIEFKAANKKNKLRGDLEIKDFIIKTTWFYKNLKNRQIASSCLNIGLHFDSYAIWQFTCAYCRSADKHKVFG
jgi:hypothetical protein